MNKLIRTLIQSLGLLLSILFAHTTALAETVTRTSAFEYDADGVLIREVVEPTNATLCVATQYALDAYGNRSASQTRNCNGTTIPGVGTEAAAPPAPPITASASGNYTQFATRTVSTSYGATTANPTAGQFPTSNTNAHHHWPLLTAADSSNHLARKPPEGGRPISVMPPSAKAITVTGNARATPAKSAIRSWPSAALIKPAAINIAAFAVA